MLRATKNGASSKICIVFIVAKDIPQILMVDTLKVLLLSQVLKVCHDGSIVFIGRYRTLRDQ